MRWEDGDNTTRGIPSRVVQYEGTLYSFLVILSLFEYSLDREDWFCYSSGIRL